MAGTLKNPGASGEAFELSRDSENIVGLYQRHAEAWDRLRGKTRTPFEAPWLDRFLARVRAGGCILDIGCGSGEPLSRYILGKGYRICGIDSSSRLVEMCKLRFPEQEWTVADMRTLALGRQFDGVLAWDSFFHLSPEDQRPMFPIFRDHAAPGAPLMFTSGFSHGEVLATFENEPLYHGSLDETEYAARLEENEFDVRSYLKEDPACGLHTIWLAQRR